MPEVNPFQCASLGRAPCERAMLMEQLHHSQPFRSHNEGFGVEVRNMAKKGIGRMDEAGGVHAQNRILEKIIQRKPLKKILSEICEWVETTHPKIQCSIMLVQNGTLHVGAWGRLPVSYVKVFEGCEIGPMVASCGTAVYRQAPVIVTDLNESPLWDNFREKALAHGLRSCWSFPIQSTQNGSILGTVALYFSEPQSPSAEDWELLELLGHVAGMAIDHDQVWPQGAETKIKFEKFLEQSPEMVALCEKDTGKITEASEQLAEKLGYSKEAIIGQTLMELAHPESQRKVQETFEQLQHTGSIHKAILTFCQSQGRTITVMLNASAVHGKQQELLYYHTHWQEMTEYMKTLEGKREREHAFREIIETIPQQVWTAQPDGALDYVNQRVTTYFHRTMEEMIGWNWQSIVHPEDLPKTLDMWHRALETAKPFEMEFRLRRGEDEAYLWHLARAVPIKDEQEKVVQWFGTNTDITERKSMEEALRKSEERYRSVAQSAPDGIIAADSQGRITSWNKGAWAQFGYEEQEILGRYLTELMPERYRKAHQEGLAKVQQKGIMTLRSQTRELVGLKKDGNEFPIELSLGCWIVEGEYAFCGIIRDISERKESERAVKRAYDDLEIRVYQRTMELNDSNRELRREIRERQRTDERLGISEAKNQALVEGIPDLMILYRMDGTIVDVKPVKGTSTHMTAEECVNRNVEEVFPAEMSKTILYYIRKAQHTREVQTAEYQATSQGKREYFEVRYVAAGESEVLSIIRNVTNRKELERQLYRHTEHLEHVVEERAEQIRLLEQRRMQGEKLAALGQLAAGVAHEINNPLASLSNAFFLIKETMPTGTEAAKYIPAVDREVSRINKIVEQMYQLYGVETEEIGPADFRKILKEVFELVGSQIQAKHMTMVQEIPDDVPQVVVPETQMIQVLCNLVQNAIDASPEGAAITVAVKPQEAELRVEVVDGGSGISPEIQAKIFEPFFTTKAGRQKSRMGLGLSVSNSLVEAMGGTIEVQSSLRKGTTFALTFPLKSAGELDHQECAQEG